MEAEIRLPLRRFPDCSGSSLIHSWLVLGRASGYQIFSPNTMDRRQLYDVWTTRGRVNPFILLPTVGRPPWGKCLTLAECGKSGIVRINAWWWWAAFCSCHSLCSFPLLDKSLTGPEMSAESFLSLRTFKKFSLFLSLVKAHFSFLFCLHVHILCLWFLSFPTIYLSM